MTYTRRQGMDDAQAAIATYEEQIAMFAEQVTDVKQKKAAAKADRTQSIEQLSRALVGSIDPEIIAQVTKETGAMGLPDKLAECEAELHSMRGELAVLLEDEVITDTARLLDPLVGKLVTEEKEAKELFDNAAGILANYETAPLFKWVYADVKGVKNFWMSLTDVLTFKFIRRQTIYANCSACVGDIQTAVTRFDDFTEQVPELQKMHASALHALNVANGKLARKSELEAAIHKFDVTTKQRLADVLISHLQSIDTALLVKTIRQEAQILLSKITALAKKIMHFQDIIDNCNAQIDDRKSRQAKIQQVLSKWRRSKKYSLSGDKTKWLVDTPRACGVKTQRFCNAYHTQSHTIHSYSDYDGFNALLLTGLAFSSFNAFSANTQVDSYVVQQTFSEAEALAQLDPSEVAQVDDVLDEMAEADMAETDAAVEEMDDADAS